MEADDMLSMPAPMQPYANNDQDTFDSLFNVSFCPTDAYDPLANPFEPTPIAEEALSA